MSIEIYAFLGYQLQDLEVRVIEEFRSIGFKVSFHPDMKLLNSNPTGCFAICIHEMPLNVPRIEPSVPLFVDFEYYVRHSQSPEERGDAWLPRKVKKHTYEIYTRTAAGRSHAAYFMQAFLTAILSKVTNGYFWANNGSNDAICGELAVTETLNELNTLEKSMRELQPLIRTVSVNFDEGAVSFTSWQPISNYRENNSNKRITLFDNSSNLVDEKFTDAINKKPWYELIFNLFFKMVLYYFLGAIIFGLLAQFFF